LPLPYNNRQFIEFCKRLDSLVFFNNFFFLIIIRDFAATLATAIEK